MPDDDPGNPVTFEELLRNFVGLQSIECALLTREGYERELLSLILEEASEP